jgi:preprotein translocase subunit SecA
MGLITKIFGTYSQRQIKRVMNTVNEIESLADKYSEMSDEELSGTTKILKDRLK